MILLDTHIWIWWVHGAPQVISIAILLIRLLLRQLECMSVP